MKFGRYLRETLIPEWRKAYLDYRGLKKAISLIKSTTDDGITNTAPASGASLDVSERGFAAGSSYPSTNQFGTNSSLRDQSKSLAPPSPSDDVEGTRRTNDGLAGTSEVSGGPLGSFVPGGAQRTRSEATAASKIKRSSARKVSPPRTKTRRPIPLKASRTSLSHLNKLSELLAKLTPNEKLFFEMLDRELAKVATFYQQREQEAKVRSEALSDQLRELADHGETYQEAYPAIEGRWPTSTRLRVLNKVIPITKTSLRLGNISRLRRQGRESNTQTQHDPQDYRQARKKLKIAMQEYYRGLELLDNYRILNVTGFRKALKKFEKVTGITSAQRLYMNEKVEPCRFASSVPLGELRQKVEFTYAAGFEKGDRKRAKEKLRAEVSAKTHHFSTFRSGLYFGLGVPPLVLGVVESFHLSVRTRIPEWGALLQIYSALVIVPIFTLSLGLNLLVWSRARINWIFIFDLDVRSAVDYRQYFELPSFLFMTLCYAFYLSFSLIGSSHISPTTWPMIWFIFAITTLVNPLPVGHRRSRWWFAKMIGKLFLSGSLRVEFADFWLGDQLCSLSYTLANLYVFACAYHNRWTNIYGLCNPANTWIAAFLSALPGLARLAQCIKRWSDSGLKIHLVNAGKYASTTTVYALYYYWRHLGGQRDFSFVLWCLFATIGSAYTSAWDLVMDWSLMRPKAPNMFLRQELLYSPHTLAYYFGIVSNVFVRFIWVWYIPAGGLNPAVRGFIFAVLESLRRWQWNFYRVENEHIGNADRYRATKEIPLPYSVDDDGDAGDESDEGDAPQSLASIWSASRTVPRQSTKVTHEQNAVSSDVDGLTDV